MIYKTQSVANILSAYIYIYDPERVGPLQPQTSQHVTGALCIGQGADSETQTRVEHKRCSAQLYRADVIHFLPEFNVSSRVGAQNCWKVDLVAKVTFNATPYNTGMGKIPQVELCVKLRHSFTKHIPLLTPSTLLKGHL